MEKKQLIKREINKLKKLYKEIPENKLKLVNGLIENAAFMKVTLDELQTIVNEEGTVVEVKNGNGFIVSQENPAQKSYNTMINRYTATIKQLAEFLPEQPKGMSKLDEFLSE